MLRDQNNDSHNINALVDKSEDISDIIIEEVPDLIKKRDVVSKKKSSRLPQESISSKPVFNLVGED